MATTLYSHSTPKLTLSPSVEFWSNEHQSEEYFGVPKKLASGDSISTTCVYDVSKRPETKFGPKTTDGK